MSADTPIIDRRAMLGGLAVAGAAVGVSGAAARPRAAGRPTETTRFADRVVLITGATSGIGEATALAFAAAGARVFFCGRREALGRQVQDSIRQDGGEATYMRADVRREADVEAFVAGAVRRYGGLDVAFNNAGIGTPRGGPLTGQSLADFDDVMRTNAHGVFLSMKHELPVLLANAPNGAFGTRGVIINNASTSGHVGFANIGPYSASKHAVMGLTKCAALEASPQGVRVVSISPGGVETPMRHAAYAGRVAPGEPDPPAPNLYRRTNTPAEMAEVVMFLASDAASSLTGVDLDVTGGFHTGAYTPPPSKAS